MLNRQGKKLPSSYLAKSLTNSNRPELQEGKFDMYSYGKMFEAIQIGAGTQGLQKGDIVRGVCIHANMLKHQGMFGHDPPENL